MARHDFDQTERAVESPQSPLESTLAPTPPDPRGSATSAITLLAIAAFAAQAMVRVTDLLLPQIAADLNVTVGATSIIVTVYLLAHGSVQLVIGPIADTVGKYRCIALAAAGSTVMVAICGLAPSLPVLIAARLGSGLATGWIIPLALAFVGDVIPYERRQQVIGRFLSGQILGQLFGQAAPPAGSAGPRTPPRTRHRAPGCHRSDAGRPRRFRCVLAGQRPVHRRIQVVLVAPRHPEECTQGTGGGLVRSPRAMASLEAGAITSRSAWRSPGPAPRRAGSISSACPSRRAVASTAANGRAAGCG